MYEPRQPLTGRRIVCAITMVVAIGFTGCRTTTLNAEEPTVATPTAEVLLPPDTARAIVQAVSNLTNIPPERLSIQAATPQDWPDGCLGLAAADELCTGAIVPGWAAIVTDGQQEWSLRSDATGTVVRLEAD